MQKVKSGSPRAKGLVVETLSTVSEKTALLTGVFSPLILVFKKEFAAKLHISPLLWLTSGAAMLAMSPTVITVAPAGLWNLFTQSWAILSTWQTKGHIHIINYFCAWQKLGAGEREWMKNPQTISATPTITPRYRTPSSKSSHASPTEQQCP